MLRLAARARPTWAGTLLLTAIAIVPWAEHHERPVVGTALRELRPLECPAWTARDRIVIDPWDRIESFVIERPSIIVPPRHPDARPWPYGMVIGMNDPPIDPGILLWNGSPLASVMSVFLAPWRSLTGLLGA